MDKERNELEQDGEVETEKPDIDKRSPEQTKWHKGVKGSYLSNLSLDHLLLLLTKRVESEVRCAGPCQALTVIYSPVPLV